jgi:signal transduction histidine kinase
VIAGYETLARSAEEWHGRATEGEMLAGDLDPQVYAERVPSEHAMWEHLLTSLDGLRETLVAEEARVRSEILALERARTATGAVLILLAALSAVAAAWMGFHIQRLRLQAERRGRELDRLMASRAHLIRGITHDVKNPLGVISGYAELLELGTIGQERSRFVLGRIREASGNALELVDDLLELSISEVGELRLDFRRVDVGELVAASVSQHTVAAEKAGLQLTTTVAGELTEVTTDARRVRQILGNLLSNAIKYTPAGGSVHVSLEPSPADGDRQRVAIRVADTGPGIPQAKLEEIFHEFARLEPGAERGTGLGLTISRRIARALGGDVTVSSTEQQGSTFTFWLPQNPASELQRAPGNQPHGSTPLH